MHAKTFDGPKITRPSFITCAAHLSFLLQLHSRLHSRFRLLPTHSARMKPFPLMDLPAEIRNQIYAHVLVEEQAIFIDVIRRFNGRRELCRINAPREHKYRGKVRDPAEPSSIHTDIRNGGIRPADRTMEASAAHSCCPPTRQQCGL